MRKSLVFLVQLLSLSLFSSCHAVQGERPPEKLTPPSEVTDKSKEEACDCCQKCMAAMKPVQPSPSTEQPRKDGCADCCGRCGTKKKPLPESFPPDVVPRK